MLSTIAYTQKGRLNVSETLRQTAIAIRNEKKIFHAQDIVDLLAKQDYAIKVGQVRNMLAYSGVRYTGHPRKRQYWELRKLDDNMYQWVKFEYDPNASIEKMITVVE